MSGVTRLDVSIELEARLTRESSGIEGGAISRGSSEVGYTISELASSKLDSHSPAIIHSFKDLFGRTVRSITG